MAVRKTRRTYLLFFWGGGNLSQGLKTFACKASPLLLAHSGDAKQVLTKGLESAPNDIIMSRPISTPTRDRTHLTGHHTLHVAHDCLIVT